MTEQMRTKTSRGTLQSQSIIDIQSEKIEMTLNTDSAIASGLLIQRLTELYENPIEASVRETISNALDALAVTGNENAHVKICTPSTINPIFSVEDNGVGMTYEDLKDVYSKYGASTKQNNFDQIGAYGLGAKAPLAYGTQFTVSSIKDGQKTTIIVAREEMTNYIKVVSSVETDEPSGTTVSIPVQSGDVDKFIHSIELYKKSPADYNADLYIDGELIDNKEWILVTDKMPTFGDNVFSKLWVRNLPEVLSLCDPEDLNVFRKINNLSHVVGGWKYNNPIINRRWVDSIFCVEIKPGLVSFNSSRDTILENDRLRNLNGKIKEYINSKQFKTDLLETLQKVDLKTYKESMLLFYNKYSEVLKLNHKEGIHSKVFDSPFLNLKRKESNFSLSNVFELTKDVDSKLNSLSVKLSRRDSKPRIYSSFNRDNCLVVPVKSESKLITVKKKNEDIFLGGFKVHNLLGHSLVLSTLEDSNNKKSVFITDIGEDEVALSNANKIVRKRNEIVDLAFGENSKPTMEYSVNIVFTTMSKDEFEKLISDSGVSNAIVFSYDSIPFPKVVKSPKPTTTRNQSLEMGLENLLFFTNENNALKLTKYEDLIKDDKNKLFVISNNCRNLESMNELKNGYCNKHDLNLEDISLYLINCYEIYSKQIELLSEMGEIYREDNLVQLRKSKAAEKFVKEEFIEKNPFFNKDPDLKLKKLASLISFGSSNGLKDILNIFEVSFLRVEKISETTGITPSDLSRKGLEILKEIGNKVRDSRIYTIGASIYQEEIPYFVEDLTDEELHILNLISISSTGSPYQHNYSTYSRNGISRKYLEEKLSIKIPDDKHLNRIYNPSNIFSTIEIASVESKVKFFLNSLEKLTEIKF